MIAVPLLVLTLGLAPTDETLTTEISAGGNVAYTVWNAPAVASNRIAGGADASATVYFRPVIDDDTAPSLQSYLQRVGGFTLSAGGSGSRTDYPTLSPQHISSSTGGASVGLDGYFGPGRSLYGSIGFGSRATSYDIPNTQSAIDLPVSVSLGVRWNTLRVRASWDVDPQRKLAYANSNLGFEVPFWGNLGLHVYGVVRRRLELDAQGYILDGGGSADGNAQLWLARRFGVGLGVRGGHQTPTNAQTEDWVAGRADFTAWLTARFAVHVWYEVSGFTFSGNDAPAYSGVGHQVYLGIIARPL